VDTDANPDPRPDPIPDLIAVDWGTSTLRGYLMSAGEVLEGVSTPDGVGTLAPGDHDAVLWSAIGPWMRQHPVPVAVGGMGTSSVGIVETAYVDTPADSTALARAVTSVEWRGRELLALPGVRTPAGGGRFDVMRGEELEILGSDAAPGVVVLAGSHCKWVVWDAPMIRGFRTYLTGELYAATSTATLLARSLADGVRARPGAAFRAGVHEVADSSLMHQLFSVRTESLRGADAQQCADRLAGLIIGEEIRDALDWVGRPGSVTLVAAEEVAMLYRDAFGVHGVDVEVIGQEAAARGIAQVVQAGGGR